MTKILQIRKSLVHEVDEERIGLVPFTKCGMAIAIVGWTNNPRMIRRCRNECERCQIPEVVEHEER